MTRQLAAFRHRTQIFLCVSDGPGEAMTNAVLSAGYHTLCVSSLYPGKFVCRR
jgi:hypothetical protein